jgi:DNA-binding GntR family transcriptional regulator
MGGQPDTTHTFEPVRRESTRELLCTAIRDAIFTGALKVGERLPELKLTAQFKVSRAVVREALQQLSHEGLIDLSAHRGAQVVDLTAEQIDETVSLRTILEPEAVRLAKSRLTAEGAALLRESAQRLEAARHDIRTFVQLDFAFHETIWNLSGNGILYRHLVLLTRPVFTLGIIMRMRRALTEAGTTLSSPGNHVWLAEKICSGSEEEATAAARQHITENCNRTRAAVDNLHSLTKAPKGQTRRTT